MVVDATAATVALPGAGPDRGPASYDLRLSVGRGGAPVAPRAAHLGVRQRAAHVHRVELAPGARLVLREEQILGRQGESTGTLLTRLTVRRAGRPLLDQQLAYGPGAPGGWDGAAVLGGHRAVGQLLVVDQAFEDACPQRRLLGPTAVLTPLAGPAVLVTAVAADARLLRGLLDEALGHVQ
ncbi:urease accessory protein UreD [Streptomyces sp. M10(2022)]